eukprot:4595710-Alexandrium_andersonii.AAC.1
MPAMSATPELSAMVSAWWTSASLCAPHASRPSCMWTAECGGTRQSQRPQRCGSRPHRLARG